MNAAATQWQSFGWHATCVDGHSIPALYEAFRQAEERRGKSSVIFANTVKGKGVSYMENQAEWHGTAPNVKYDLIGKLVDETGLTPVSYTHLTLPTTPYV